MMLSAINQIVSVPPELGHRIRFARMGGIQEIELTSLFAQSGRVASRLLEMGVSDGDRIGILAANCPEWVLLDLAALRIKAVTAGLEPGKFSPDSDLLRKYELRLLFTDLPATSQDPAVRPIAEVNDMSREAAGQPPLVTYGPDEATTIKFTSGSTGEPKGLGASAGSIDSSLRAVQSMFQHGPGDDIFVFLPLSLLQQRYWVYSALLYGHDVTVSTYEAAFAAMRQARPTVIMGVPGFFEAARRHVESRARLRKQKMSEAAAELFGGRVRYLWTGSAPASPEMLQFYTARCGIPIYEGYGLNETCIVAKNSPVASKVGSVGKVLPGKQVLIDEDGVISVRSEHPVGTAYTYAPTGESERVFVSDGVVRTGDLGFIDDKGFLFVRGRADDVIVLENGRKILVRPIEEAMCSSPDIEQCVLFCPAQTHLVAVVSPARGQADPDAIARHLAKTNESLSRDEQIHRVVLASEPFTVGNGMLTSQYKPRRKRVFDKYQKAINDSREGVYVQ